MTGQEISSIQDAIKMVGLSSTKFPKKLEIRIPRAKFPGIYLSIPTDGKSFELQVYFQQVGIAFIEKLSIKPDTLSGDDMSKTFSLAKVKGMPSEEEMVEHLNKALESVVEIGIVRAQVPEMAV